MTIDSRHTDVLRELQSLITDWADQVIPHRTLHDASVKLLEEVAEAFANPGDPGELADMAILVMDMFHLAGVDMEQAIRDKMAVNKQRSWQRDPRTRILKHV
ncbi:dATP/dGTP pyrophosphohydrolase domain-containing protein [Zhongshania sp.]|uniref:dATP/dGTP pyrophosphohydrolase domain-containing protein n=1 Tax=Zhongshania sp. TaxID=1971902 RepID=UPI003565A9D4